MIEIPLTQGMFAQIDDEDYEKVSKYKWTYCSAGYAFYSEHSSAPNRLVLMLHRYIIDAPNGFEVDHIDRNGLNNQKSNLRLATRAQNLANRGKLGKNKSSKYKGVCRHKNKWQASIKTSGEQIYLGRYETEEAAAMAYNYAAQKYFGEYAFLNKIA